MVDLWVLGVGFFPLDCILKFSTVKCWMKSKHLTVKINCWHRYHLKALHHSSLVQVHSLQTMLQQKLALLAISSCKRTLFITPALFKPIFKAEWKSYGLGSYPSFHIACQKSHISSNLSQFQTFLKQRNNRLTFLKMSPILLQESHSLGKEGIGLLEVLITAQICL